MKDPVQLIITIAGVRNPLAASPLRRGFLLTGLALGLPWLALSPAARAQCSQQGCDDGLPANTFFGHAALIANTSGEGNTAIGFEALLQNTTGNQNTAIGEFALWTNIGGSNNVALGDFALANITTGNDNIAIGASSGSHVITGSDNIDIGNLGKEGDSKTIRVGTAGTQRKTFIAGISGAVVPSGVGVIVGSNGQLGTVVSSVRYKEAILPMDKSSEAIHSLRPVTFRYKEELDPEGIPQFGLVAEQVEKVNPDLVARDADGKPYSVRYEAVNAMLLNEFLKEHREVQELKKQVAVLTAGLQKVSAQLELNKVAPQTVVTNQ